MRHWMKKEKEGKEDTERVEQLERDIDVDRHRNNNQHFSHVRVVLHAHAAGAPKRTDTG